MKNSIMVTLGSLRLANFEESCGIRSTPNASANIAGPINREASGVLRIPQLSLPRKPTIGTKSLIRLLVIWISMLVGNGVLQAAGAEGKELLTFVFLNSGAPEKRQGYSKEELGKMQTEHVGNFGTQYDHGKLMTAGPQGESGILRGTVTLAVNTPGEIADCFKNDPFIQHEILKAETHPWLTDVMKFGSPVVPFKMTQHTLCIVKKGSKWDSSNGSDADAFNGLFPSFRQAAQTGELAISGPFQDRDKSDKLGIMLFYSTNQAQIQAQLDSEPVVKEGRVAIELHSQFMGKGTFPAPGESTVPPAPGIRTPLFDGKSFAGWEGDTEKTWRTEAGALVGGSLSQTVPHNEFISTTKRFKNFDLRMKVKLDGTGFVNGGIQFRSERTKNPAFEMTGYQADMGEGYWGCLYDESRRNKVLAHTHAAVIKHLVKRNDWNDYVVRCEDDHIRLWLNGVLTVDYTEADEKIARDGFIALQIHGGGKATASYKDISIAELP
jgi:uncharacterized protein YciI